LVKQRNIQRGITTKARRMHKPFKLSSAWKDIPHIIRTPIYGLILGIITVILLPRFWVSPYTIWIAVFITLILIIFGIVFGSTLDLRDNIKDQIK